MEDSLPELTLPPIHPLARSFIEILYDVRIIEEEYEDEEIVAPCNTPVLLPK